MAGIVVRNNPLLALGLENAKEKILQYYPIHAAEIEPVKNFYLATMLYPQIKLNTLKQIGSPSLAIEAAEDYFKEVYHRYKKEPDKEGSGQKGQRTNKRSKSKKSEETSMSFFYDASQLDDDEDHDGESELRRYFSQESMKAYESIDENYRRKEFSFPTNFRMARDYLSVMAISSPSESLFSQVKSIVTDKRNRLQPITIKMLAILKARRVIRDDASVYIDSGRDLDEATNNSNQDYTKILDTNSEKHSSGVTGLISANIVDLQDVDNGKKMKRSEAGVKHRLSTMSGTECADNSDLQSSTGLSEMKDIGASGSRNSGNTGEAESLDTTHDSTEYSDREMSDAGTFYSRRNLDVSDAETLNSSHSLELIDMGSIDSWLKKVSQSNIDLRRISDSGEDEEGEEGD